MHILCVWFCYRHWHYSLLWIVIVVVIIVIIIVGPGLKRWGIRKSWHPQSRTMLCIMSMLDEPFKTGFWRKMVAQESFLQDISGPSIRLQTWQGDSKMHLPNNAAPCPNVDRREVVSRGCDSLRDKLTHETSSKSLLRHGYYKSKFWKENVSNWKNGKACLILII